MSPASCTLSSRKRRFSRCQVKSALPVRSAAGLPAAEMNSTFGTSTRLECSSRKRITFLTTEYMKAEPNEPGKRRLSARTRLMLASPSICAPPRKKTSMRPCPARSKSSREPSVNGFPVRFCSREILNPGEEIFFKNTPVAGMGEAAPTATCFASPIRRAMVQASSSSIFVSTPLCVQDEAGQIFLEALGRLRGLGVDLQVRVVDLVHPRRAERPGAALRRRERAHVDRGDDARREELVVEH